MRGLTTKTMMFYSFLAQLVTIYIIIIDVKEKSDKLYFQGQISLTFFFDIYDKYIGDHKAIKIL